MARTAAVGCAEAGDRPARAGTSSERVGERALQPLGGLADEDVLDARSGAQVIDVPAPALLDAQVPADARPQPARPERRAAVDVKAGWKPPGAERADDDLSRLREPQDERVGAGRSREARRVGAEPFEAGDGLIGGQMIAACG